MTRVDVLREVSCFEDNIQPRRVGKTSSRLPDRLIRHMIEHPVACTFAIPGEAVWARGRGDPRKVLARQVAMYLAHVTCGLTLTETGHLFLRDRTTVAHACKRVEALRDDRRFDHALELLEGAVRSLSPPYAAFALAC